MYIALNLTLHQLAVLLTENSTVDSLHPYHNPGEFFGVVTFVLQSPRTAETILTVT
jgi:hypothetical protein